MTIYLSTTGTEAEVYIRDLSGAKFIHPALNVDLTSEFDLKDITESVLQGELANAMIAGSITLSDAVGNTLSANQPIDSAMYGMKFLSVRCRTVDLAINYNVKNEIPIILTGTVVDNIDGAVSYSNGIFTVNTDCILLVTYNLAWVSGLTRNAKRNHIRTRVLLNDSIGFGHAYTFIEDAQDVNRDHTSSFALLSVQNGDAFYVGGCRQGKNSSPCNLICATDFMNQITVLRIS